MDNKAENHAENTQVDTETPAPAVLTATRTTLLFLAFLILQIVIAFVISFPIGIYIGATSTDQAAALAYLSQFELLIGGISLLLAALIIFWMTRRTLPGKLSDGALASLGWQAAPRNSLLIASILGAVIAAAMLFILMPAVPPTEGQSWGPMATASQSEEGWQRYYWLLLVLLIAPPVEEFIFRGMLFTGLSHKLGTYLAALIVSGLFVGAHVAEAIHYWPAWIALTCLAIATMTMRIQYQSLLPALATHFSYNLVIALTVVFG